MATVHSPAEIPAELEATREQVRDELRRADSKATTLLSLVGATLAGLVALTQRADMSTPALAALWVAAAPIGASVALLLATVRPRLGRAIPGSWLHAAQTTGAELLAACEAPDSPRCVADDTCQLARLARTKYRRQRVAVALLGVGLGVLGLALALNVIT